MDIQDIYWQMAHFQRAVERYSELLGLKVGDTFTLNGNSVNVMLIDVSGVYAPIKICFSGEMEAPQVAQALFTQLISDGFCWGTKNKMTEAQECVALPHRMLKVQERLDRVSWLYDSARKQTLELHVAGNKALLLTLDAADGTMGYSVVVPQETEDVCAFAVDWLYARGHTPVSTKKVPLPGDVCPECEGVASCADKANEGAHRVILPPPGHEHAPEGVLPAPDHTGPDVPETMPTPAERKPRKVEPAVGDTDARV